LPNRGGDPSRRQFLIKERRKIMKKNLLTTGILILVFAALFTACPQDAEAPDGPEVEVPKAGDLPALPTTTGVSAVATEAEAKALLTGMGTITSTLSSLTMKVVETNGTPDKNGNWSFDDKLSPDGEVKVSASYSVSSNRLGLEQAPKPGDTLKTSITRETKVILEKDLKKDDYTLLKGGTTAGKSSVSVDATYETDGFSIKEYKVDDVASLGLTVSSKDKAGKIIVEFTVASEIPAGKYGEDEDLFEKMKDTYTGTLKVYGADDKEVYTLDLSKESSRKEVSWLEYFFSSDY
jgi:hypothetical protein